MYYSGIHLDYLLFSIILTGPVIGITLRVFIYDPDRWEGGYGRIIFAAFLLLFFWAFIFSMDGGTIDRKIISCLGLLIAVLLHEYLDKKLADKYWDEDE